MFDIRYDVLEELVMGDTYMHLAQSNNTENPIKVIRLWSSLSKQWNVMHRANVEYEWERWKKIAEKISKND